MAGVITLMPEDGWFIQCSCGNDVMSSGFLRCDENGVPTEDFREGFRQFYVCVDCGAVARYVYSDEPFKSLVTTLEIVRRPTPEELNLR